jgi:hypothetical protein
MASFEQWNSPKIEWKSIQGKSIYDMILLSWNNKNNPDIKRLLANNEKELLEWNQSKNREEFNIKTETWTQLESLQFNYSNDNWISPTWKIFWDDIWKTFWLDFKLKVKNDSDMYKINTWFNHYTAWEKFVYNNNWERNWNATDFSDSTRIDQLNIDVQKRVLENIWNDYKVDAYLWVWVNILWQFWGEAMQKKYHELLDYYEHKAVYENVSWFSPTLNWSAELNKILYWNNQKWIYAYWDINAQLALIKKYWETNINAEVWLWVKYNNFLVEVYHDEWYKNLPTASKTIQQSWLEWHNTSTGLKVSLPLIKGSSISYKYSQWNNQDNMTIWFDYKF